MKKLLIIILILLTVPAWAEVKLTPDLYQLLDDVNLQVNYDIVYQKDKEQYGRGYWTRPTSGYGDCEDYGLEKQYRLKLLGVRVDLARCIIEDGRTHIVCLIDTDRGTLVLDNRTEYVFHYQDYDYEWSIRQKGGNEWYAIEN